MHPESLLLKMAAEQGGVISRSQALGLDVSDRQISLRIRSGRWSRVAAGRYRILAMDDPIDRAKAAASVLPDATLSHFTAAAIQHMDHVDASTPTVTVHARTTHSFPGVVVVRTRDLLPRHTSTVDGFPVTTPERTIVDLAAVISTAQLGFVIDAALASRRVTLDGIRSVFADVARKGKPGVVALRAALDGRGTDTAGASMLEARANRLLRQSGLPPFETEYPIPWDEGRRFDVAFVAHRVAIEWDSHRWHSDRGSFERDRRRDRLAILNGWRVLRFTWGDVEDRPGAVLSTVEALVRDDPVRSVG